MIAYLAWIGGGALFGSLLVRLPTDRWEMRQRNIEGLRADRLWFRELGWSSPTDRQRDKIRLDLATAYVRRNWWWTSKVQVFTEDIDAKLDEMGQS